MSNMLHSYLSLPCGRVELWLLNQRLNKKFLATIMCVWVDQVSIGYKYSSSGFEGPEGGDRDFSTGSDVRASQGAMLTADTAKRIIDE